MEYPDEVEIISVSNDPENGTETRGLPQRVRCYFEDASRMLSGSKGMPVQYITFMMLPPYTKLKNGDFIRRYSKAGIRSVDASLERVMRISVIGSYSPSHLEGYTGTTGGIL